MSEAPDLRDGEIDRVYLSLDRFGVLDDRDKAINELTFLTQRFRHNLEVHDAFVKATEEDRARYQQTIDNTERSHEEDNKSLKEAYLEIQSLNDRLSSMAKMRVSQESLSSNSDEEKEKIIPSLPTVSAQFVLRPIDAQEKPKSYVDYVKHVDRLAFLTHQSEKIRIFLDAVRPKWSGLAFCRNFTTLEEVCKRFLQACRTQDSRIHAIDVGGNLKITVAGKFEGFVLEAANLYERLADEEVSFPNDFWNSFIRSKLGSLAPKFVHCRTAEEIFDHGLDLELQGKLFDFAPKLPMTKKTNGTQSSSSSSSPSPSNFEKQPSQTKTPTQDVNGLQSQQKPHQGSRNWNDNSREKQPRPNDRAVNAIEQDNFQPFETYGISTNSINKQTHSS